MFDTKKLFARARAKNKTIIFPEAGFSDRTIEAVKILHKKKICNVILVGDESSFIIRDKSLLKFTIMNPKTCPLKSKLVKHLYTKRKEKGMTMEEAENLVTDPYYFATLLVDLGIADGMVAGAEASTARALKPALQIIKTGKKGQIASSSFLIFGKNEVIKNRTLLLADCGLNVCPTADELVTIANQTIDTAKIIGLEEMNVAFLSYSSNGSAKGEVPEKMATAASKFSRPAVVCDGELQLDSALCADVAKLKVPNSKIQGNANILIFPDLSSGNITYKAMQILGNMNAIGPIVQGLKKPVNDLSRGCSVQDIVILSAITALQAKEN